MSGLMRRLNRGRATPDDEATQQAAASETAGATTNAQPGESAVPAVAGGDAVVAAGGSDEQATAVLSPGDAATAPAGDPTSVDAATQADATEVEGSDSGRDLPAGVDPGELAAVPTTARRGRLRRRLRYLRAVREILMRDLGGFYYEAQRGEGGAEAHRRLLDAKAARLATVDAELRDLEARLHEARSGTVLRAPGIGGTCPHCGELHASDARFCSRCGNPLGARAARERAIAHATAAPTTPPTPIAADDGAKASTASLWGRPKRPDAGAAPAAASRDEAGATSRDETGAASGVEGGAASRDEAGATSRDETGAASRDEAGAASRVAADRGETGAAGEPGAGGSERS
jgi:hypothetical protein